MYLEILENNELSEEDLIAIMVNTQKLTYKYISVKDKHYAYRFKKRKPSWWKIYLLTFYTILSALSLCSIGTWICNIHLWIISCM